MNSLEFIEKEIKLNEKFIRYWKQKIEEDKRLIFLSSIDFSELMVKTHQEEIQILQQIKTILEAWYICKQHAHINKYEDINKNREKERFDITIWLNTENCDFESCASYEDCLKVRKALEVNE